MKFDLIAFFLIIAISLNAQTKKVLFLGNSYTGVNNLSNLVYDVCTSTGDTIFQDKNTPGGTTLSNHASNLTSQEKIKSNNWDYVVLQAQSQEPSFPIGQVETETFPFAAELSDSIRANNSCSRPMFYMTWGRENGDASNCASWPPVCTYEGMDSLLNLRYRMMAEMNDGYVSPVGAVWHYIRDNHPDIDLYANDGSHPSQAGSYAAACTFYSVILQKDPTLIQFNYTLSDDDAALIKNAAKVIAFDNLSEWNIGNYDPVANFTFDQSTNVISFTNSSTNYESLNWDFGDGNTSTASNPMHSYPSTTGTYEVTLLASQCGITDTITQTITVISTQVDELAELQMALFPNPVAGILNIKNSNAYPIEVKIYNLNGSLLKTINNPKTIDMDGFHEGVYFISIKLIQNGKRVIKKIIKVG